MIKTTIARTKGGNGKPPSRTKPGNDLADCGYCSWLKVAHQQPRSERYGLSF